MNLLAATNYFRPDAPDHVTDEADRDATARADSALYRLCREYDALRPFFDKLRLVRDKHLDDQHQMNVEEATFFLRDVRKNISDVLEREAGR